MVSRGTKIAAGLGGMAALGAGGVALLVFGGLALLVAALLLVPYFLAGPLQARLEASLAEQLQAEVKLEGLSVSLFSSFPALGVEVQGLKVTNLAPPFEGLVLAEVQRAEVGVDWWGVVSGGPLTLRKLHLEKPRFHVRVLEDGRSNASLGGSQAPDAQPTPSEPAGGEPTGLPALNLRSVQVTGLDVRYEDAASALDVELTGLDHRLSGSVGGSGLSLDTDTQIAALSVRQGGVRLLDRSRWDAKVALDYDLASGAVTFGENRVQVNQLALNFEGRIAPQGDDLNLDVKFSAPDTSFASVLSLVPSVWRADFDQVQTSGTFAFRGSAAGLYRSAGDHLPRFDLGLTVADASFKLPDLPASVVDIGLELLLKHPEGALDLLEIDVPRFHMAVVNSPKSPFDATLSVRNPMTDPDLRTTMKGQLNLTGLANAVQLEGMKVGGMLDMDLALAGRMSAFEAGTPEGVSASGFLSATDLTYEAEDLPVPVTVRQGKVTFDLSRQVLEGVDVRFGSSDLQANGEMVNLVGYSLGQGVLKGRLDLTSQNLDLRPFQTGEEEEPTTDEAAEEEELAITPIPPDLDLALTTRFQKVRMQGMAIDGMRGSVAVKDQALTLDKLALGLLGGTMVVSGTYAASTPEEALVDFGVDMNSFEVDRSVRYFTSLERIVPALKGAPGKFDSGFKMKTRLQADGSPDFKSLVSQGSFRTFNLRMVPDLLGEVEKAVKTGNFKSLDLDGAAGAFEIEAGKLKLDDLGVKLGNGKGILRGGVDIERQALDLVFDVKLPVAGMARDALAAAGLDTKVKEVDLKVKLTGPYNDPKVKVTLGDSTQELVDEVRDEAMGKVREVADDLIAAASAKGDLLIAEAEKLADKAREAAKVAADKVRDEAKKAGDKLVKEAGKNPVKQEVAKKAAEKLREEANKRARDIEQAGDKEATKLVNEAKAQKEKLVAEATEQSKKKLR